MFSIYSSKEYMYIFIMTYSAAIFVSLSYFFIITSNTEIQTEDRDLFFSIPFVPVYMLNMFYKFVCNNYHLVFRFLFDLCEILFTKLEPIFMLLNNILHSMIVFIGSYVKILNNYIYLVLVFIDSYLEYLFNLVYPYIKIIDYYLAKFLTYTFNYIGIVFKFIYINIIKEMAIIFHIIHRKLGDCIEFLIELINFFLKRFILILCRHFINFVYRHCVVILYNCEIIIEFLYYYLCVFINFVFYYVEQFYLLFLYKFFVIIFNCYTIINNSISSVIVKIIDVMSKYF